MDLYPSWDLLEHFRLDAKVTAECTTHIEYKTDRAQGIRKEKVEGRWYRMQCIGRGMFGVVWLEVKGEGDRVEKRAVKAVDKRMMQQLGVNYKNELLALSKFSKLQYQQEEVLVKFLGWFEDSSNIFLSMEYFELGDLEQHIEEPLTEDDMKDITTDVLNGLRIMHSENFAHRDLKPSNILVVQKPPTSNWWVKIGGFGISKRAQDGLTELRTQVGTLHYEAPEIRGYLDTDEPTSVYDNAVDMWSLGCIIYRIATQKIPFPSPGALFKFCAGILPFPEPLLLSKVSADGTEFIKTLITPNPRDRLSAMSALEASWLSQRKRNTILKTEESSEQHVSTIAQTAKFKFGSPSEVGMSPHSVALACGFDGPHVDFPRASDVPFEHIRPLGAGSSGQVDEVRSKVNNKVFARKLIRLSAATADQVQSSVQLEVGILRSLAHEHIIRVNGTYRDPREFAIIMSPVAEGDLDGLLHQLNCEGFPERMHILTDWFTCLTGALAYVHGRKIQHKDIKPRNILFTGHRVFLADFGSSYEILTDLTSSTYGYPWGHTRMYSAPEVIAGEKYGRSADIFSLGCVFTEMANVLHKRTIRTFYDFRVSGTSHAYYVTLPKVDEWFGESEFYLGFIQQMIAPDRHARPKAMEVLERIRKVCRSTECTCTHPQAN